MSTSQRPARLTIGTRGSALALVQSALIRDALLVRHPDLTVELQTISTRGDRIQDRPLAAIGGKGLFISDIESALCSGAVDLAVHSAKDLPSEIASEFTLRFCLARADAHDVLVSDHGSLSALPVGARVGTSSPRRACQLKALRPDLQILDIRGNVDTRLRKLAAGDYDALVLAAAGLERLAVARSGIEHLSETVMLPAAGQGVLAVEARADDVATLELVAGLVEPAVEAAVLAERSFVATVGGSCTAAVAAYATVEGTALMLAGLIGASDGRLVRGENHGACVSAEAIGHRLATSLLAAGGAALLAEGSGSS